MEIFADQGSRPKRPNTGREVFFPARKSALVPWTLDHGTRARVSGPGSRVHPRGACRNRRQVSRRLSRPFRAPRTLDGPKSRGPKTGMNFRTNLDALTQGRLKLGQKSGGRTKGDLRQKFEREIRQCGARRNCDNPLFRKRSGEKPGRGLTFFLEGIIISGAVLCFLTMQISNFRPWPKPRASAG